jgi:phosphoribosyl 1,2-cyclic phosphodiesterase
VKVTLLGVRGSTPVSGSAFLKYGGQTSCVAITFDDEGLPTLLLDAGTGLQSLGSLTGDQPFRGTILCTHMHWDHVQGLPFSRALDAPRSRVRLFVPADDDAHAGDLVDGIMRPPYFPVTSREIGGTWAVVATPPSSHASVALDVGGAHVTALDIPHKGGRAVAYRVEADGVALVYAPDHALSGSPSDAVRSFFAGAEVLLHDAQFTANEAAIAADYGHSTIDRVLEFGESLEVSRLVLTHHAPTRRDDELDLIAAGIAGHPFDVHLAQAGTTYDLTAAPVPM